MTHDLVLRALRWGFWWAGAWLALSLAVDMLRAAACSFFGRRSHFVEDAAATVKLLILVALRPVLGVVVVFVQSFHRLTGRKIDVDQGEFQKQVAEELERRGMGKTGKSEGGA